MWQSSNLDTNSEYVDERERGPEDEGDDDGLFIEGRTLWDALPSRRAEPLPHPILAVFCMNTMTEPCSSTAECVRALRRIQRFHMAEQRHRDIRFNFVIGGDGVIYEGRGWFHKGLLPDKYKEYSSSSLIIGFIGEYTEMELPDVMIQKRNQLVKFGIRHNLINKDFLPFEIFMKRSNLHTFH